MLNTTRDRFDVIVIDCFAGERGPAHLLTIEAFQRIRSILTERGRVLINHVGFAEGPQGRATRSFASTLREAGFQVSAHGTDGIEEARNIIATVWLHPEALPPKMRAFECCDWVFGVLPPNRVELFGEPAHPLTDGRLALDALNVEHHEQLRSPARQVWVSGLLM